MSLRVREKLDRTMGKKCDHKKVVKFLHVFFVPQHLRICDIKNDFDARFGIKMRKCSLSVLVSCIKFSLISPFFAVLIHTHLSVRAHENRLRKVKMDQRKLMDNANTITDMAKVR